MITLLTSTGTVSKGKMFNKVKICHQSLFSKLKRSNKNIKKEIKAHLQSSELK